MVLGGGVRFFMSEVPLYCEIIFATRCLYSCHVQGQTGPYVHLRQSPIITSSFRGSWNIPEFHECVYFENLQKDPRHPECRRWDEPSSQPRPYEVLGLLGQDKPASG